MTTSEQDRDTLQRIRALKRIEASPDGYPKAVHTLAVRKLNRVRQIVGV